MYFFVNDVGYPDERTAYILTNPDDIQKVDAMEYKGITPYVWESRVYFWKELSPVVVSYNSYGFIDRQEMVVFSLPNKIHSIAILISDIKSMQQGSLREITKKWAYLKIKLSRDIHYYSIYDTNVLEVVADHMIESNKANAKYYGKQGKKKQVGFITPNTYRSIFP